MNGLMENCFMPGDMLEANRLLEAYVVYVSRGQTELAHACKREIERLKAYKRENDQLEYLKENLRSRGFTEIVIKIENLHIHG